MPLRWSRANTHFHAAQASGDNVVGHMSQANIHNYQSLQKAERRSRAASTSITRLPATDFCFANVTTRLRTTLQHFHFFPVRLSILSGKTKSKFPIPERACPLCPGFCPAAVVWFLAAPWLLAGTVGAPCAGPFAGSWGLAAACLGWSLLGAWPVGVVAALAAGAGEEASSARLQPRGSAAITCDQLMACRAQ